MMEVPGPVITVVASVLAEFYYSHRRLNTLFAQAGAPGDPPEGCNCHDKCVAFLRRCNADETVDAFGVLGAALADFMEVVDGPLGTGIVQAGRDKISAILARYGLRYEQGGRVRGALAASPSRTFEDLLRSHDFTTLDDEFKRAIDNVETDPAAALTAACATLESICQIYIEDENLVMPARKTVGDLWPVVKSSLSLDPRAVADDDLRKILGGIASVVDGMAAFRTYAGSAHGRGREAYRPAPRHARLGVHAAHTLAAFIIETWDGMKAKRERA